MSSKAKTKLVDVVCPICKKVSRQARLLIEDPRNCLSGSCANSVCSSAFRWSLESYDVHKSQAIEAGIGLRFIRDKELPITSRLPVENITFDHCCAFFGPVQTGKTWALSAIICDALANGYAAQMTNWHELQVEVRSTYQAGAKTTEHDLLERYKKVGVLCIDDIGATKSSEAERTLLYSILDARYRNESITHISSNMTLDELEARYDARIARRIREMCKVVVLQDKIEATTETLEQGGP